MVLPEMVERKDGVIIIVSSIGGLRGSSVLGTYAISKARRHAARAEPLRRVRTTQHPHQLHPRRA